MTARESRRARRAGGSVSTGGAVAATTARRASPSPESAEWITRCAADAAVTSAAVSVHSSARGAVTRATRVAWRGTRMSAMSAAMNTGAPIDPMRIGRRAALRARADIQADSGNGRWALGRGL